MSNPFAQFRAFATRSRRRLPAIAWVLILALTVRCLTVLAWTLFSGDLAALHQPDTATYLAPAHSLLASAEFLGDSAPEIRRGPGYPLLLALGLATRQVEAVTIALQIVLSIATVYFIYRTALSIDDRPRVALSAALLYAVEPLSIMYCCFLLTETLFMFLLAGFMMFLARFIKQQSVHGLVAAAFLLAASAFVRPVSYYLPLVVAGLLFWVTCRIRGFRWGGIATASFLLCCAVPFGAWQMRNSELTGYPGFSAIAEHNLYFYQAAAVDATLRGESLDDAQTRLGMLDPEVVLAQHPKWQSLSEGERHVELGKEAKAIICRHPLLYARLHLRSILSLLITPGSGDLMRLTRNLGGLANAVESDSGKQSPIERVTAGGGPRVVAAVILSGFAVAYLVLAMYGIAQRMPLTWRWTLMLIGGYFWLVSCVPEPPARLRHPLMAITCMMAAYGLAAVIARIQDRFPHQTTLDHSQPIRPSIAA